MEILEMKDGLKYAKWENWEESLMENFQNEGKVLKKKERTRRKHKRKEIRTGYNKKTK